MIKIAARRAGKISGKYGYRSRLCKDIMIGFSMVVNRHKEGMSLVPEEQFYE